ncbi:TPA: GTP-binding protein [Clostridium perfringens]
MSKKLSELKDEDMIIVDGYVMSKEDFLNDFKFYKNKVDKVYTATQYKAHIDAWDMLESALENEYQNMHEEWFDNIVSDVTDEDIKDIQSILDRILSRSESTNICYTEDEKVEIDL